MVEIAHRNPMPKLARRAGGVDLIVNCFIFPKTPSFDGLIKATRGRVESFRFLFEYLAPREPMGFYG